MKAGDYIRSVNDQYVQNLPLFKIYNLVEGPPNTPVKISMYQSALEKPQDFTLTRRAIAHPYVEGFVSQQKIGYIRIKHLLSGVENEVETKLNSYNQQGI